ncbi:MAG: hypothetical protein CMA06_04660 [Euryarchaeota archaeon]|nr:hypothetical protein [Euryarchaeota archaeon]
MINIRIKIIQALMILTIFGCMRPDDENLWSTVVENTIGTNGFTRDVYVQGDTAFIAAGQSGLQIWNLESEILLEQYGSFGSADLEDVGRVHYDSLNSLIFIMDQSKIMFDEYDSTLFDAPTPIGDSHNEDFIVLSETGGTFYIYYVDRDAGDGFLWGQYDFEEIPFIGEIWQRQDNDGQIRPSSPMKGLSHSGDRIAVAGDQMGVYLYGVDLIGDSPEFISRIDTEGNAEDVLISNNGVFVSCDDAGAYFIPMGSFSGDEVLHRFADNMTVDHIAVKNEIASLSLGSKGIALYDISDPTQPEAKGIFPVGYTYRTVFWKDRLLACTREGLQVLKIEK